MSKVCLSAELPGGFRRVARRANKNYLIAAFNKRTAAHGTIGAA
jgi:hypothetical protein